MTIPEQLWWHVARSTGIVAWALLAAAVLLGVAQSSRALGRRPRPAWLQDLHRGLGGLAVVFTGLHLAGLVADDYVSFGVTDLLVPFASAWNPGAVAWGVVALYLLVAVEVTSLLRRRLPTRSWRVVHLTSFPLYAIATAHLLTAGTDASNPLLLGAVLTTLSAIGALTLVRLLIPRTRSRQAVDATPTRPGRAAARTGSDRGRPGRQAGADQV